MKQIYSTTLRLNLNDAEERMAWEHLRRLDRKQYHSVSKAIVVAVNAYFGRQEQLAADPYLETREKEDAFLQEIREAVQSGLRFSLPVNLGLVQPVQSTSPASQDETNEDDMAAALDFADSL